MRWPWRRNKPAAGAVDEAAITDIRARMGGESFVLKTHRFASRLSIAVMNAIFLWFLGMFVLAGVLSQFGIDHLEMVVQMMAGLVLVPVFIGLVRALILYPFPWFRMAGIVALVSPFLAIFLVPDFKLFGADVPAGILPEDVLMALSSSLMSVPLAIFAVAPLALTWSKLAPVEQIVYAAPLPIFSCFPLGLAITSASLTAISVAGFQAFALVAYLALMIRFRTVQGRAAKLAVTGVGGACALSFGLGLWLAMQDFDLSIDPRVAVGGVVAIILVAIQTVPAARLIMWSRDGRLTDQVYA